MLTAILTAISLVCLYFFMLSIGAIIDHVWRDRADEDRRRREVDAWDEIAD